jgi:type I restriction enzyme S subunit
MAARAGNQSTWEVRKLSDVLVLHYGKALKKEDRRDGPFPVFGSSGIVGSHDTSLAKGPGVIVGRKGNVGSVFWSETDFFVIDTAYYVTSSLPLRFLYYLLPTLNFINGDAAVPGLSRSQAYSLDVRIPPLPIQRRIAGILSAYDELIENSQRRIKILESMARALYREWFVHFRFPGHESVPRVPSPLGEIPKGWEVKTVPDCVHINPRVAVPRDGEKPFVPMGCLANDSMHISDIEVREGNSGAKFQNDDTLFARITPCLENGKTGFVQFLPDAQSVGFGSTEFIVLRSRTLTPEFVYLLARSDEFRGVAIKSMSGATGRQRVQEKCFDDLRIAQPPSALLDQFALIVSPSFQLTYKLHLQIQNLRRTRDLLLPRLLSGQIDVEAMAS